MATDQVGKVVTKLQQIAIAQCRLDAGDQRVTLFENRNGHSSPIAGEDERQGTPTAAAQRCTQTRRKPFTTRRLYSSTTARCSLFDKNDLVPEDAFCKLNAALQITDGVHL